ncbi:unnamed protein product [Notodromas monacha]|uniref:Cytochrome P450 n=1 Tax=Notodromas monacha TaxID=399045 RepID=A0A7R9BI05_9CRUS|nr:unnamed protein product [Notodromas monacha]CAG0914806.1 unnamed protein product [Notodromas monacha]
MIGAILFTTLAIILWMVYAYKSCLNWRTAANLPPGPPGSRAFVGHYFLFNSTAQVPVKKLAAFAADLGSVFTLKMGFRNLVVVNDFNSAVLVCKGHDFHDKPFSMLKFLHRNRGMVNAEGDTWYTNKKFCAKTLKEQGFGGRYSEQICSLEAKDYLEHLKTCCNKPYDFTRDLYEAVSNVVGTFLIGPIYKAKNLKANVPELGQILAVFNQADPRGAAPELQLLSLLSASTRLPKLLMAYIKLKTFVNQLIEEARAARKDGEDACGVLGAYIGEKERIMKSRPNSANFFNCCKMFCQDASKEDPVHNGSTEDSVLADENQMKTVASDILIGGVDTMTSALSWIIYSLCKYPEMQKRIANEVEAEIGSKIQPSFSDRNSMNFTRAFLYEVARMYPAIAAQTVCSNKSDHDFCFSDGISIPKGTPVYINIWAALRDPQMWKDPNVFHPERFLDSEMKFKKPGHPYNPFGFGKRMCLGEPLVMQMMFIFTTSLLQEFKVSFADDNDTPALQPDDEEGEMGVSYFPRPFHIVLCKHPTI